MPCQEIDEIDASGPHTLPIYHPYQEIDEINTSQLSDAELARLLDLPPPAPPPSEEAQSEAPLP